MKKPKNIKKPNYRKISNKVKKIGDVTKATNSQLERLFNIQHIKYVTSLEDQLAEDKAHLLLKQNTIETLEEDIRVKSNLIRRWQLHGYKNAKEVNKVFKDYKEANKDLSKQNKEVIKDNYELTRAYNGLHTLGKFAVESGVDIKKYNGQLPENNKFDFEQKHTLTEAGKVRHQYKIKPKKKVQ
tara:strand:- start:124 stop:675 length:552 start_codon:yes stop_codon:yes gene_type:complete